jgi:hypothetical protein
VAQVNPIAVQLLQSNVATGGKCGATSIDRNFVRWMTQKFGTAYTSLDMKKRGPGSLFMNSFESEKRNFGSTGNDRALEIGPIEMEVPYSIFYDDDEQFVKLSRYVSTYTLLLPLLTERMI